MRKIKKVILIIIAIIIGISTTVGAATVFNSKDITYSSTATTKKNVKDSLDELYTKASKIGQCPEGKLCLSKLLSNVPVGSYVKMTPTATSYTIPTSVTGYSSSQTINPSELSVWRIIGVNGDGTVEMVSDKVSSNSICFSGKNGYINFIGGLNTIATQYMNNKYVQSTRYVGYSSQTQTIKNTDSLSKTKAPWANDTDNGDFNTCLEDTYNCGSGESLGGGDRGWNHDFKSIVGVYNSMQSWSVSTGQATEYWFASRYFDYVGDYNFGYAGRTINTYGGIGGEWLYGYVNRFSERASCHAIRPIVIIKPGIMINGGTGEYGAPYTLS